MSQLMPTGECAHASKDKQAAGHHCHKGIGRWPALKNLIAKETARSADFTDGSHDEQYEDEPKGESQTIFERIRQWSFSGGPDVFNYNAVHCNQRDEDAQ